MARHEAGHAIAAHRCGGRAERIVFGTTASGYPYGRATWEIPPDEHKYLLVLSAGPLALFLHDRPAARTFWDLFAWVATEDGHARAISGASDWIEILRRTQQPAGYGIHDFLARAVQPYFDETCQLLDRSRDQLDALTNLLLDHPPGLGPRALKRFFAGKPASLLGHTHRSYGRSLGIGYGETRCQHSSLTAPQSASPVSGRSTSSVDA